MTHNEIRAAFATIANNTSEEHTKAFALDQFAKLGTNSPAEAFVWHLRQAHNILKPNDGRECNVCRFEQDSGIIRDPVNGWAIRND